MRKEKTYKGPKTRRQLLGLFHSCIRPFVVVFHRRAVLLWRERCVVVVVKVLELIKHHYSVNKKKKYTYLWLKTIASRSNSRLSWSGVGCGHVVACGESGDDNGELRRINEFLQVEIIMWPCWIFFDTPKSFDFPPPPPPPPRLVQPLPRLPTTRTTSH
jgi:hypothetical protein